MNDLLASDAASTITALTGLVSAVGVIALGFLQYRLHVRVKSVGDTTDLTALAVSTANGHTLGEVADAVAEHVGAVVPDTPPDIP